MDTVAGFLAILRPMPNDALLQVGWVRERLEALISSSGPSPGLTVAQVAAQLNRGESTVRTLCAKGTFAGAYRLRNREWRIPAEGLAAFLTEQKAHHAAPEAPTMPRQRRPADLGAWRRLPTPPGAA